jgi:hypothetical protein
MASILDFPPRDEVLKLWAECGFSALRARSMALGGITLFEGEKRG